MCDETVPREMLHPCLFAPERKPRTDLSIDTTKVQLGKPMSFLGVTYRNRGEELLTGAKMT